MCSSRTATAGACMPRLLLLLPGGQECARQRMLRRVLNVYARWAPGCPAAVSNCQYNTYVLGSVRWWHCTLQGLAPVCLALLFVFSRGAECKKQLLLVQHLLSASLALQFRWLLGPQKQSQVGASQWHACWSAVQTSVACSGRCRWANVRRAANTL